MKAEPLDVKLDMSGEFPFANTMRNGLGENHEANAISKSEFSKQEDVNWIANYRVTMNFGDKIWLLANN